jgi:uncharacterized repeat protein (TIGR03803 family)
MGHFSRIARYAAFAVGMLCLMPVARAATFVPLYSFCHSIDKFVCTDGSNAGSRLLQIGADFYGTTSAGGPRNQGTIFRITGAGAFKQLYSFCAQVYCPDGAAPGKYIAHGPDGDIYGVATRDGANLNSGSIFKITTAGQLTRVYGFCSQKNCLDGFGPIAVAFDKAGNLFGTTTGGGSYRFGTLFEITAKGAFVKLHDFCSGKNCADGIQPGALVLGRDGNFYGTTATGGANQAGTIFRVTPTGKFTTLYSFCAAKKCADGAQPTALLTQGRDGNFYGTTLLSGAHAQGTVFQVTPTGILKTLYSFCARPYCDDGNAPLDGLTLARDGSLYGTTSGGGVYYNGVLFNITTGGSYKIIHNFCAERGCFDGALPAASPILGRDGNLYGATTAGGDKFNVGEIYKLTP